MKRREFLGKTLSGARRAVATSEFTACRQRQRLDIRRKDANANTGKMRMVAGHQHDHTEKTLARSCRLRHYAHLQRPAFPSPWTTIGAWTA